MSSSGEYKLNQYGWKCYDMQGPQQAMHGCISQCSNCRKEQQRTQPKHERRKITNIK